MKIEYFRTNMQFSLLFTRSACCNLRSSSRETEKQKKCGKKSV
jgi:hypothetical protein